MKEMEFQTKYLKNVIIERMIKHLLNIYSICSFHNINMVISKSISFVATTHDDVIPFTGIFKECLCF